MKLSYGTRGGSNYSGRNRSSGNRRFSGSKKSNTSFTDTPHPSIQKGNVSIVTHDLTKSEDIFGKWSQEHRIYFDKDGKRFSQIADTLYAPTNDEADAKEWADVIAEHWRNEGREVIVERVVFETRKGKGPNAVAYRIFTG